jgi:solute carrier family 25 phosphate transporter 3
MPAYRANPFFAPSAAFMLPSIGEKVDNAAAQAQAKAQELKADGKDIAGRLDNKVQDLKEAARDSVSKNPTGVDLYARYVAHAAPAGRPAR